MPFVSVKCTSCGGEIQLDDQRETGFCLYCGTKVVFQEAIQKMKIELSGNVTIAGIATLEQLLQNAYTFRTLDDFDNEKSILIEITNKYPQDFRAWWGLAVQGMSYYSYERFKAKPEYPVLELRYGDVFYSACSFPFISNAIRATYRYLNNALKLAPDPIKDDIKRAAENYYEPFLNYMYTTITPLSNAIAKGIYNKNEWDQAKTAALNNIYMTINALKSTIEKFKA